MSKEDSTKSLNHSSIKNVTQFLRSGSAGKNIGPTKALQNTATRSPTPLSNFDQSSFYEEQSLMMDDDYFDNNFVSNPNNSINPGSARRMKKTKSSSHNKIKRMFTF
jgi:hypothetical protein